MGGTNEGSASNRTKFNKENFQNALGSGVQSMFEGGYKPFDKSLYAGQGVNTQGGFQSMLDASNNPAFQSGVQGAIDYTSGVASGGAPQRGYGLTVNPQARRGYETLRQGAIDDTITATNSPFLSSGTYGSDKHRQNIGQGVGRAIAGMDYQNYRDDIGMQERDIARQEGARLSDQAMRERSMANLPALYKAGMMPGQTQLQVGQMQDADRQAQLLGEQDLFRRTEDANYTNLARTLGLFQGGLQGATGGQEQPNPFFDILGTAIGVGSQFL